MTDKTKSFSIRVNTADKKELAKHITRKSLESILRQIESKEIEITDEGVVFIGNKGVNTSSEGVNTTIEQFLNENPVIEGVNTDCENCPYINDLNMSGFDEVCEFKRLDRQKALDKCVGMLWKG